MVDSPVWIQRGTREEEMSGQREVGWGNRTWVSTNREVDGMWWSTNGSNIPKSRVGLKATKGLVRLGQ